MSVQNQALCAASSSSESVLFSLTLNLSRSKFGSKTEGMYLYINNQSSNHFSLFFFLDHFLYIHAYACSTLSCFRCREKQRKEASRLQAVNRKLTAMNKLLMEENDRLQKQVSQLVYENTFFRQQTQNVSKPRKKLVN